MGEEGSAKSAVKCFEARVRDGEKRKGWSEKMKSRKIVGLILGSLVLTLAAASAWAHCGGCGAAPAAKKAAKPEKVTCDIKNMAACAKGAAKVQTTCPVMGGEVNPKLYADVKGYRVYVCCRMCVGKVKADPGKYIAKIKAKGQVPELVPVVLCKKCGQIKGSDVCCKKDQKKCTKCKLVKGSPGCCKIPKDTKGDVVLCQKCGEIKGSDECCKADAKKCKKCGLVKGSPGCCKIGK